jgi:alkylhydroperoxidase family enzyme
MGQLLEIPHFSHKQAATIILAMSVSPSPTMVTDPVIELVLEQLSPAAIIEVMVWLSLQQLLHRLSTYYSVVNQTQTTAQWA